MIGVFLSSNAYAQIIQMEERVEDYLFQGREDIVRGFTWDLPKSIIKQNEKGQLMDETDQALFFFDFVRGARAAIGYEFTDEDQLWRVSVFNEHNYKNPQDRIEDLLSMQVILERRYGEPTEERFLWRNERGQNIPEYWGYAVYQANLAIEIIWKFEETDVILSLKSPRLYEPEFKIDFEKRSEREKREMKATTPPPLLLEGAENPLNP
ncbi:MAG: hypothetical protein AAF549_06550 [Pseudomonadota bacterium]